MKTLGLIGGTTWLSTVDYYNAINHGINQRLGGLSSAKIILYSVNFEEFIPPAEISEWSNLRELFIKIALTLETAGAECIVLCANTPHLMADKIRESIHIPLIHIAEATHPRRFPYSDGSPDFEYNELHHLPGFLHKKKLRNPPATEKDENRNFDF